MKFLTEPTCTVMAYTVPTALCMSLVPEHDNDFEIVVSTGAKTCYDAHGPDGNPVEKNVRKAIQNMHYSVLEHVSVSFLITGVSRGLSHELVRHRHASPSQRSTRYVNETGGDEGEPTVVLEPRIAEAYIATGRWNDGSSEDHGSDLELRREWINYTFGLGEAFNRYTRAIEFLVARAPKELTPTERRKWAMGSARQLLPHALETQIFLTANFRSWREILLLRSEGPAEAEIRRLMHHLWFGFFKDAAPAIFSDFREVGYKDGFVELAKWTPKDERIQSLENELKLVSQWLQDPTNLGPEYGSQDEDRDQLVARLERVIAGQPARL